MSTLIVEACLIDEISEHGNADSLEIATVKGWECCVRKDSYKKGDMVVFIPPDALLPKHLAEVLDVSKYLGSLPKLHSLHSTHLKVRATRLRSRPSYGLITGGAFLPKDCCVGDDLMGHFQIEKWEPPVKIGCEDQAKDISAFPKYTSIENIKNFPDILQDGEDIIITEKIHGTNSRVGYVDVGKEYFEVKLSDIDDLKNVLKRESESGESFRFVGGSHNVRRRASLNGVYWEPLFDSNLVCLIKALHKRCDGNVVVYGELFGVGVQDMSYGGFQGKINYRIFDILLDGVYQNYEDVGEWCSAFCVDMVPILYSGPYSKEIIEEYTDGLTTMCTKSENQSKFKGREGIVIRPKVERMDNRVGRVVLKSVSVDYLARKDPVDEGE